MSAGKWGGRRMLRRPKPSARRPIGTARCLGEAVCPRMPVLDVALLGSREDCHRGPVARRRGPVARRVQDGDGLEA
eukprot:7129791-Alexandrium_andersonii.AAC.1